MIPETGAKEKVSWLPVFVGLGGAVAFFAANFFSLGNKSLWVDEMRTGYVALFSHSLHELFRYIILNDPASPLYSLLAAALCKQFGSSEVVLRMPSLIFGALSLVAFAFIARRLVPRGAASVAVIVLALSPNMIYFSQEARAYSAFLFVSLLAYLVVIPVVTRGAKAWPLALCFVIGIYVHLFFVFVMANCFLYAVLFRKRANGEDTSKDEEDRTPRKPVIAVFICAAIALISYAPWLFFVAKNPDTPERLPGPSLTVLAGLLTGNAYAPIGIVSMSGFMGLFLLIYGAVRLFRLKRSSFFIASLWIAAPIILILVSFTIFNKFYDMFHFRYLIYVLPFISLIIGAGIWCFLKDNIFGIIKGPETFSERFAERWVRPIGALRFFVLASIVLFAASSGFNISAYYKTENQDWRDALHDLEFYVRPGDIIVLQGIASSSIEYYAELSGSKLNFVPTNRITDTTRIFRDNKRKYFVYYREKWGKPLFEKSQQWLDSLSAYNTTFQGLFGDVVVGYSYAYTLTNDLTFYFKDIHYDTCGYYCIKDQCYQTCSVTIFNRGNGAYRMKLGPEKGNNTEFPVYAKLTYGQKEIMITDNNIGTWINLNLQRGEFRIENIISRSDKFTIEKVVEDDISDENTGPEMRGYFLDWIRK